MIFLYLAIFLGAAHFIVPACFYGYLRKRSECQWGVNKDDNFEPRVTIILPTYNESSTIKKRLDNLKEMDYPSDKTNILLVDSASTDETVEIARGWKAENHDPNLEIMEEPERRGMVSAENFAIERMPKETEVVVLTDSDCKWREDALKNAVKYFNDPSVGVVTCRIYPYKEDDKGVEETYRNHTDMIRLNESRIYATPVAHGSFLAIDADFLVKELGKLPEWTGADDSPVATYAALNGHRAITAPDVIAWEHVPDSFSENIKRKTRRAQHLIQNFLETPKKTESDEQKHGEPFNTIYKLEKFIHVFNPWILLFAIIMLVLSSFSTPTIFLIVLVVFSIATITVKSLRSWLLNQAFLMYGFAKNLFTKTREWEPLR